MRKPTVGVLLVAGLVVLAGCSGAVVEPTPGSGETTQTETTPAPTATSAAEPTNGTLAVHKINVGQGSATLVVGPNNETMLIDTGDWRDDGENVLSYLKQRNIDRLDYLVTSHPDADHIGGHEAVIDYYETEADGVGAIYDPGIASSSQTYDEYLDAVERHDVTLYQARAGDTIPIEDVRTRILAPPEGYLADRDANENSLVVRLTYGNASVLLPGDVESAGEQYLVEAYGSRLDATVLGVPHHGSKSSSSGAFLDATDPRVGVISSAYDSQYGHPHEEVLQRLADRSVRTYWTATHGDVRLTTDGSTISIATERTAPTAPLELREGTAIQPDANEPLEVRTRIEVTGDPVPLTPDGGTATATAQPTAQPGQLAVATIHADAAGDESANLNDEYIVFENTGDGSLDLSGWTISDAADHTYTVPDGVTVDPGNEITLHTGSGTDSATDLYWGAESAVWNNGGDTISVRSDDGTLVLEESY